MSAPPPPPALPTRKVRELRGGHTAPLQVVAFNSDGRYCVTGGQDRLLCLWNPYRPAPEGDTGGLLIKQYRGHGYEVTDVLVSSDNTRIVSCGGDKCAFVWDVSTGGIVRKVFGHDQRVNSVALNDEATVLFTASNDKLVRAWDLRASSRAPIQSFSDFHDNATKVVVAGGDCIVACSMDGSIRTYDLRAARCVTDSVGVPVATMALSRDGNCVLASSLSGGGRLVLLERPGGSLLSQYSGGHANGLYRLQPAFTSDDAHVVAPSEDGSMAFYDLVAGSVVGRVVGAHRRVVSCVAAHPSPLMAGVVMSASFDGTAALWCAPGAEDELAALVIAGGTADELQLVDAPDRAFLQPER